MIKTLEYHYVNGSHVIFDKYTIDESGVVRNKENGEVVSYYTNRDEYNLCGVLDDKGDLHKIYIGRAIASTFHGQPPTSKHTADHKDRVSNNDTIDNIRWATKKEQRGNQDRPETYKNAFIIVKDGLEKTGKEWVDSLKDEKNHMGREYTLPMIRKYAQKNQHGFSYKKFPDISGEVWKEISGSKNTGGHWEISNMCRLKYITNIGENVLSGERLCIKNGYPKIGINGKSLYCHIIAFETFFPEEYANKKSNEIVLHDDDDPLDFRPHKLRLGTRSENGIDAHDNGSFDDKKKARMKCASYINGIFEQEHDSQDAVVKYLKSRGYTKASQGNISQALLASCKGKVLTKYDRTYRLSA